LSGSFDSRNAETAMRRALVPISIVLLATSACDGDKAKTSSGPAPADGSPKTAAPSGKSATELLESAESSMQSKEWKSALASLDAVVADAKATGEEKAQAWPDKVFCEVMAGGQGVAKASLQKMADSKAEVGADKYFKLGNELAEADQLQAALDVIGAATERFKGDAKAKKNLTKLAKNLAQKLQASGDTAGTNQLKSLGYLGGGDDDN
jgi:hypothetical protein